MWLWEFGDSKVLLNTQEGCCSVSPKLSPLLAEQAPLGACVLAPSHLCGPLLNSLLFYLPPRLAYFFFYFYFIMDTIFGIWPKKHWAEEVNHFSLSAGSVPADTSQSAVKLSLLPGPLLARVQLTVPQGTQVLSAELFPLGYSFLGIGIDCPTPVCPMNTQSELTFKSPWDLLVLNTRVFASFQTKLIRQDIPIIWCTITTHAHWQHS